jgi:hypothetical protein
MIPKKALTQALPEACSSDDDDDDDDDDERVRHG